MSNTKWPLSWISEEKLIEICRSLIKNAQPKKAGLDHRNIVDPFSALFDMAVNDLTYDDWVKAEVRRQQQKSLQNAIGMFHQIVLGSVDGWEDLGVGQIIDLRNQSRKIVAEVKNKYNTVKGSDQIGVYNQLARWRGADKNHRDYTAYYVQILVKKEPFNRPFTPSDNTKAGAKVAPDEHIREIDGRSFYELVTGSKTAIDDLYAVLPAVLAKASENRLDVEAIKSHPMYGILFSKACNNCSIE